MKVIINESEHGLEYAWEVVSACEKVGIQCIADERPQGEILFYDPKGRKYATDKDLMDADVQIWDLFDGNQKNELYDEVMLDAIGKDFEKFSVKWNANQKQVGEKDIMATKNCNRIIGNYNETRIVGKRKPSKEFLDKVEQFKKKWRSLGKPKADDEEDYVDDFGDRVNGIEAQVSEGNEIDSAVVYFKDKSDRPMVLKNVHDPEGAFEVIRYILSHEPGDIADIDHIKIGSKVYDKDDIDDYLAHEHELEELDYMYIENYEDDPRDWSASEGEVEIMWDTDEYEDFGIFNGEGSTYLIDYDLVDTHDDLINEVCRMIGKEYPDLDFGTDDFTIINEDEFWEQRGGNPGKWEDETELFSEGQFDRINGIPDWATYYILNGEVTGEMNDDDVELVDNFLAELKKKGIYLIEPIDGTYNEFNSSPKFGDACDTNDWTCEVN